MSDFFDTKFFVNNRKQLFANSPTKVVAIASNTSLQRNGDTQYEFRQDSNFWYLTGIDEPDYTLVITEGETFLIRPRLTSYQKTMETQASLERLRTRSGVKEILSNAEGWAKLKKLANKYRNVGIQMPANTKHYGMAANPARRQLQARLKRSCPRAKLVDVRSILVQQRMIKQPEELAALQQAIDITIASIKDTLPKKWHEKFAHEYEVEAALSYGFRKRGADGNAFLPIVISGHKTASVHNFDSADGLARGATMQIDVGAEVSHYAADISRVYPVSKEFTPRQAEIVAAVKEVQNYALSLVKPGAIIRENEKLIETYMGKVLKRIGLISSETRSAIRARYPHACSHLLGLDVHDAADYSIPLKPNMVLTVEPGIYIPEEGLGVRIEDDVLVTKDGAKVLTADLPQQLH